METMKSLYHSFRKKLSNGYLVSYGYSVFHVPIHSYQSVINCFRKTLQAGSSKPWPETLEEMTGSRKMDASAMLEYFKPLNDWLDQVPIL
jgi:Angiotensin-converting enzyme